MSVAAEVTTALRAAPIDPHRARLATGADPVPAANLVRAQLLPAGASRPSDCAKRAGPRAMAQSAVRRVPAGSAQP